MIRRSPFIDRTIRCAVVLAAGSLLVVRVGQGPIEARQGAPAVAAVQSPSPQGGTAQGAQPTSQQIPTFRGGVNVVRVDVIVSDRQGQAVDDLRQADFEVTEDGKPQKIETFKLVHVDGQVKEGSPTPRQIRSEYDEESEAAREDVRLFAIFFDDYHVRRMSTMVVKPALTAFVEKQIGPNDLVGLMTPLLPVSAMPLTRDRSRMLSSIKAFEGRKYDYRPRNDFEEKYAMYPASVVERIRNQVTLSALESLVTHMGSLREGRKAVILVSEGFSNLLPAQLNDPIASMPGIGNPARGAAGLESIDDRTAFQDTLDINSQLREVYNAANRYNTAIYALDPRGLSTGEFDLSEGVGQRTDQRLLNATLDTLRTLASETDGRAIVNRNDLESGLTQVVRDSSAYYLIGYNSTNTAPDGKFHEIKVKTTRAGVQIRSRRGYWAFTKEEMARSLNARKVVVPAEVTKALGTISEPSRGRYVRSWIGTGKAPNGRTRVTFVWEPLPPVPGVERIVPSGVMLMATQGDQIRYHGVVKNGSASSAVPPPPPPAGPGPGDVPPPPRDGAASPAAASVPPQPPLRVPASVTFDAEPGTMQVRLFVRGTGGETLDTEIRETRIPDLTGVEVSLSTPIVFRSGNAREFRELMASPSPVPTASREFRRTERLLLRFEAYAPSAEAPTVTARVLNRAGNAMADLQVSHPELPGTFYQVDVPLAGFAAGEYLIEVKARGREGQATELVPLKITS
jgi:VWFA-related protein